MRKLVLVVLSLCLPVFGQSQSVDLRKTAGCGPAEMKFSVKTGQGQSDVAKPEAGKALVYVIEEERPPANVTMIGHVTTRVGLDGNWVGANHGNSYFSFPVAPGKHRVCTDWQSLLKSAQKLNGAADLAAKEGMTYFFRVQVRAQHEEHPAEVRLEPVDEAQGLLLISRSALSTSKAKK